MNRVAIRVIGAPLILAALGLILYFDHRRQSTVGITIVIAIFAAASFRELCVMARLKGVNPSLVLGLAGVLLPYASMIFGWAQVPLVALFPLVILVWMVIRTPRFTPPDAAFTVFAFAYISLLVYVFRFDASGSSWLFWLLYLVATNKGSDMAAYVTGKTIGRHKLAPTISPNKTWEGSIGGFIVGTGLGFLVLKQILPHSGLMLLVIAALTTVAAQLGDLVKSVIKRWAGVKDSGRLLPEFGGALDMVDSFILSAPVAVMSMSLLL